MKHESENQGNFTQKELNAMHKQAERRRDTDLIMILEHRGYRVLAQPLAMDKENVQMIAILEARKFKVINKDEITEKDVEFAKILLMDRGYGIDTMLDSEDEKLEGVDKD